MKQTKLVVSIGLYIFFSSIGFSQKISKKEIQKFTKLAKSVSITRDNWGIAHVSGLTDADAIFGMLYAQCEDDFNRIELNYIEKLGRLSEIKGQSYLYNDLEIRLLIDQSEAKKDFKKAPLWLKKLLQAYADGINFYLFSNPKCQPKLLTRFEPWFPLLWTDGSIGAISTAGITTSELMSFYPPSDKSMVYKNRVPEYHTGSNGFAIAPAKSVSGNSILYINPHTTFYFRPEIHIKSNEGLNAYGAVTWGQFFIYQGFNENCGWMHTSSNVDVADLYEEKISSKNGKRFYEYDQKLLPLVTKKIALNYLENNQIKTKYFQTYYTNHGPIMAKRNDKWISLKSNNRDMNSLIQSWIRTKSKNFEDYKAVMNLKANTSNNTVYADNQGNIAYWHGNYIPIRDSSLDWTKPVDGSTSKTEWQGLHDISETVHVYNPKNGWIQNCNSTPFSVTGKNSLSKKNYKSYMAPDGENFRSINTLRLLENIENQTIETIIAKGYDTKLSIFEVLIPSLIRVYEANVPNNDTLKILEEPIQVLKNWNYYGAESSIATTLANEWAFKLNPILQKVYIDQGELDQVENTLAFAQNAKPEDVLPQLQKVINELEQKFGSWKIPWGEINRFQRTSGEIELKHDDNLPSLAIPFGSVVWGSLPAFRSKYYPNTIKRYGYNGNSFVCAVEFGKKIKAKSLLAGGNSSDEKSLHFMDQAQIYQKGVFKEVLFYDEDIKKKALKTYHPGQ